MEVKKKTVAKYPSKRRELIGKYATAQSYLGVDITLKAKAIIIGDESLDDCSIHKLNKLLIELRRLYKKRGIDS
jgi:hypothetical protein